MKTTDNQKEIFVVVDKNDNILSYKTRGECHSDKSLIHRSTSIVVYNAKGEILLQKRSKTKDMYPGCFTTSASGHVGRGETYRQAAAREMMEEIGVRVTLKYIGKYLIRMPQETEFSGMFTATHNGPFKMNRNEVERVIFMPPSKIKSIKDKLTPSALECFRKLEIL